MKRFSVSLPLCILMFVCAGCNTLGRQPQLKNATISPDELKPGDAAVVTVVVKDRHNLVRKVQGVVREDPSITLKLRNDGVAPDEKAGDKTWSLEVDVPFQAPAGNYTLDVTAYRSDGTPVPVRSPERKTVPLSVSIPVVIKNP